LVFAYSAERGFEASRLSQQVSKPSTGEPATEGQKLLRLDV